MDGLPADPLVAATLNELVRGTRLSEARSLSDLEDINVPQHQVEVESGIRLEVQRRLGYDRIGDGANGTSHTDSDTNGGHETNGVHTRNGGNII